MYKLASCQVGRRKLKDIYRRRNVDEEDGRKEWSVSAEEAWGRGETGDGVSVRKSDGGAARLQQHMHRDCALVRVLNHFGCV